LTELRNLMERIGAGEILICDGAMGTMLMTEGLTPGECPERLNLDSPAVVEKIARQYLEAGADIVQTNTFGGSPLKLAQYSLEESTEEINRTAVEIVRRVTGHRACVSASVGPSGRLLKPFGDIDPGEMFSSFERQIGVLAAAGVDMINIETMSDLTEATLAVKAAKSVSPSTPVAASMTFDLTPNGFFTIMGVGIEKAAFGLADAGADIVGSNCGNGMDNMVKIAREFRRYTSLPVIIQSNAGIPVAKGDGVIYPETPEFMAEGCRRLLEAGVSIVGGCCGTTPDHIAVFAGIVKSFAGRTSGSAERESPEK
jgi:5-methyltetrahydrofolate--homocysteine methyltransferase